MSALNEKHLELIDKYLIDDLSADELQLFNKELKNEAFRNELLAQGRNLDTLDEIVNADLKAELLNNVNNSSKIDQKKKGLNKWLLLGLSIILLSIVTYFLLPSKTDRVFLADNYFTPYPPDTNIRGVEDTKTFSAAMKSYANENYESAIDEFLDINPRNENLEIYLACSYLKVDKFNEANKILNKLQSSIQNQEALQNIEWYKTLSMLGLGKNQEAVSLLKKISVTKNHLFRDKALKLLTEL